MDNDGDHPGETERLVYLPEGSDSGWRANWQYGKFTDPANNRYNPWLDEGMFKPRFEGQPAHITPPIAPYHPGPAGMVYDPGTALSDEWRHHFFVAGFRGSTTNAAIRAFRLRPEGAGFALASDRVVLQGILTVGLAFGPDGALYLADWIRGWDSKGEGASGRSIRRRRRARPRGRRSGRCCRRVSSGVPPPISGCCCGTPTCGCA